jgi:hypothetical protein
MAKSITADLEPWPDVAKDLPTKECGLLLGDGGASIAMWSRFGYSSLYDVASTKDKGQHLTAREVAIFKIIGTKNFEETLSAITVSGQVWKAHDLPSVAISDLRTSYKRTKASLLRAIGDVHARHNQLTNDLRKRLCQVFEQYDYVYTSNYNLLLPWTMASAPDGFKDFFWGVSDDGRRTFLDPFDINLWKEKHQTTKVLFLHGALHLGREHEGTFKRLRGDLSPTSGFYKGAVPLFVSEGSFRDKRAAIARNDYLLICLQPLFEAPRIVGRVWSFRSCQVRSTSS